MVPSHTFFLCNIEAVERWYRGVLFFFGVGDFWNWCWWLKSKM